jgi:hypothetical protein
MAEWPEQGSRENEVARGITLNCDATATLISGY